MPDDALRLLYLTDTIFLAQMSAKYPQPHTPWQLFLPLMQLHSCVVSIMHGKPCKRELQKMCNIRGCTGSWPNSDPHCRSTLIFNIYPSLESKSFKYTYTGSNTPITTSDGWTDLGKSWLLRRG